MQRGAVAALYFVRRRWFRFCKLYHQYLTIEEVSMSAVSIAHRRTPWHIWVVAVLTLVWNGSGAYTIMMAQAGRLPELSADEAAYYAAQPIWFVIVTDIALLAALAAGVTLLLRSRIAAGMFALSLAAILVTNVYDLVAGTSRVLVSQGALIVTLIITLVAVLQLVYAWTMKKHAVLK
jgi:hypothetical protein